MIFGKRQVDFCLTVTCVWHASVSAKVLLLCRGTLVAKPKATAVGNAAHHLMEMLLTHTRQLLQTCFYGGAFIWFSASSWGLSCCPISWHPFVPLLPLQGLLALGKGRGRVFSPADCIPASASKETPCASKITLVWKEKAGCFLGFV